MFLAKASDIQDTIQQTCSKAQVHEVKMKTMAAKLGSSYKTWK